jgi:hypothetical protein
LDNNTRLAEVAFVYVLRLVSGILPDVWSHDFGTTQLVVKAEDKVKIHHFVFNEGRNLRHSL